jgi:peptidoglycan/xylan/chitin deacetylase (PgdA/CDA1 family)
VILAYHNIVPTGEPTGGDAPLHLPQQMFAAHLDRLLETHDVVPLAGCRRTDLDEGRPQAILTFDDAYRGTLTAGGEELKRRGLTATVFVPPGLLGSRGFWWDRLASPDGTPLPNGIRDHVLSACAGRHDRAMEWGLSQGLEDRPVPEHMGPASEDEVLAAVAAGFTIGSHTWSHPNLAELDDAEIHEEIGRAHEWIAARPGFVNWFAYPYGLYGSAAREIVRDSTDGALLIEGGHARVRGEWTSAPELVPRISVPSALTPDGLSLRLAGLR